jgi:arylsulfatase A-like enzyme
VWLLLGLAAQGCTAPEPPERIVLIVIDTLRRDHLSPYGGQARTPNLARLAGEGRVLQHAVSSFYQTSMSMGALFTGRTPSIESGERAETLRWNASNWCGMARFGPGAGPCLPMEVGTLGETMRRQGYWTVGVASNPLTFAPAGFERGFHRWTEVQASESLAFMAFNKRTLPTWCEQRDGSRVNAAVFEALAKRPHDRFFLYVHYMDVHDWFDRGVSYLETVEAADAAIGKLLDHLEERQLLEGTAILVTGDHGEVLGEEHGLPTKPRHLGNPAFEQVLDVPLIVRGIDVDDRVDRPIRSQDILGVLARSVGTQVPQDGDLEPDELFVTELSWQTYRSGRFKSFWRRSDTSVFLVDLESDPGELRDVSVAHPEIVAQHRARIETLSRDLGTQRASDSPIGSDDLERLRVLGYAE